MAIDKPASYSFHRAVKNPPKDVKSILGRFAVPGNNFEGN
jgi:hypothetical protein